MSLYSIGITSVGGFAHDNSVALLKNGKIIFAASEERYSRIKHDGSFPDLAIKSALDYTKTNSKWIKSVAVGFPPRSTLSVLRNQYFYEIVPFALRLIIKRNFRLVEDLYNVLRLVLGKAEVLQMPRFLKGRKIVYVDHHKAHAVSASFSSGLNKNLSIVIDAFGPDESAKIRSGAIFVCDGFVIKEVMSIPIYASMGNFFQSVTYALGFKPGDGEGKTMGLAAYGNPKKLYRKIKPYCPDFRDGKWFPARDWLAGLITTMPKLAYLFKVTKFGSQLDILLSKNKKEDVAAAAQAILEDELVKLVKYIVLKYPEYHNICLSGGIFLNVKANKKIREIKGVDNVFVQPNAGDGGTALGAAYLITPEKYLKGIVGKPLLSCGLGMSFTNSQILRTLKSYGRKIDITKKRNIFSYTVDQIIKGKVIGWFQGRAEWGPRALGFRSVIADPRKITIKERINHVLKNREWFMPFAPSVLEENGNEYFKKFKPSPYMTMVYDVMPKKKKEFIAAMHIDKTARPNSVNPKNNPVYYRLLKEFRKKTGLGIILNTSFNRHGLPIVNSPEDAVDHLIMNAVDELVIGPFVVRRAN